MDELLFLEPRSDLDRFIVGVGTGFGGNIALVYDKDRLLNFWANAYMGDTPDLSRDDAYFMAVEWFEFNTIGAYMGEHTPIYVSQDDFDMFCENYEVVPENRQSLLGTFESMSNSEIDLWKEAFGMAQAANFNFTQDNWATLLDHFLTTHREDLYTRALKRWVDLRNEHPTIFTSGGQLSLDLSNMDSSFQHSPELEVLGWSPGLSYQEKSNLLDAQFKRDFARVVKAAIKQEK